MALQFVGGKAVALGSPTSPQAISLTDLTGGLTSQPAANDLVIVAFFQGALSDLTLAVDTAGYTTTADLHSNDTAHANLLVAYKAMGGSPDTSVTVSTSNGSSNRGAVAAVHVWRGADTSTPLDVATTTAAGADTGRADPPVITPTTSGAVVIGIGGGQLEANFTSSDLSNFVTNNQQTGAVAGVIGMGSSAWTTGSLNPAQFGGGTVNALASWCAATLALRPGSSTIYNDTLTETTTPAASLTGQNVIAGTVSFAATLASALTGGLAFADTISFAVTTGATLTGTATYNATFTETVAAADTLGGMATYNAALSEAVTTAFIVNQRFDEVLAESLTATDSYASAHTMPNALAEALAVSVGITATVSEPSGWLRPPDVTGGWTEQGGGADGWQQIVGPNPGWTEQ